MPPTGLALVDDCIDLYLHNQPQWYSQQDPRCNPWLWHHGDCSGGICGCMERKGAPYPCTNSWQMARDGHAQNLGISLEVARWTPGAVGIIGYNEGQDNINNLGHVFMFVGDGIHTFEWRGRFAGVGIFTISSHERIDYCMYLPGVDYSVAPIPAPIPLPPKKKRPDMMAQMYKTDQTPIGRVANVVCDFDNNRVLLQDGGRCVDDHPILKPSGDAFYHGLHYWRPPKKDWIPGWSLQGLFQPRDFDLIVVRYVWGENNGGTYLLTKLGKPKGLKGVFASKLVEESEVHPDHPEAQAAA